LSASSSLESNAEVTPTPMTVAGMIVAVTSVNFHWDVKATIKALMTVEILCKESPNLSDKSDCMVLQWEENARETAPDVEEVS
jgi:hypothetical protein